MDTMNNALPESMELFVQSRVAEEGYSSGIKYGRELIRSDQKRHAEEKLDALLVEGINSGQEIECHAGVLGGQERS